MFSTTSYRGRLIVYISVLMVFLMTILVYFYRSSRDVLFNQAESSIASTAQLLDSHLLAEKNELLRYTTTIRDDVQFQEYMFVVVNVNSEVKPLEDLYKSHFNWLPIEQCMLLDTRGKMLLGGQDQDMLKAIKPRLFDKKNSAFTYYGENGLSLVALSPITYRDNRLGNIAITRPLDRNWLKNMKEQSNGELFIVQNGIILDSTLEHYSGEPFILHNNSVLLGEDTYTVHSVSLPETRPNTPQLWFGVSRYTLTSNLSDYTRLTLIMVLFGGISIMAIGLIILRDFGKPLQNLMAMTGKITAGELPVMKKMQARNEVETLANQFADMLISLREKQQEIDRVHKQLEEMATTDILTGLYNRRHLQDIFPKLMAQVERDNKQLTFILADLDYFKRINDRYGHLCGDEWLRNFSSLLKAHSRTNDFLFRMGGEEFLILSMNEDIPGGLALAEKLRAATENSSVSFEGHTVTTTVSCGISSTSGGIFDLNCMLSRADEALYESKHNGRNQVTIWSAAIMPKSEMGNH